MKKYFILFLIISLFYFFVSKSLAKSLTIPDDAVRIRIIPNSNSKYDQMIKSSVRDKLEITMYDLLKDVKSSDEAREVIKSNLDLVKRDIDSILNNVEYDYDINYGYNYFPLKEYKGVKYEEGYYESLLVTLGKGEGDNWWCVLFPPLCLIEAEDSDDVQYKSFVEEILEKYIH